ncbi:MAG: dihydrodipicolinate synthase family protein [Acidiphilium sp.]
MPSISIKLPNRNGGLDLYRLSGTPLVLPSETPAFNRMVFSAAHVVVDPLAAAEPALGSAIDWTATLAYRRYLTGLGLGIAEAMDTAQRGQGLAWPSAIELVRRTLEDLSGDHRARIFSGVGTDHVDPARAASLDGVVQAYLEQLHAVQRIGGRVILMASRALARVARSPDDYATVYGRVLSDADRPVILHWLGDMFDPALAGYWGADNFDGAIETALAVIRDNVAKIEGIKISLLDKEKEIRMRRLLPDGVRMYTGDDFNYPELIKGDDQGYSHALLGIFDAIAPAASIAMGALAAGDIGTYDRVLAPTVPLSRTIFRAPTFAYKTGVVFLAWLNGFQDHFVMLGGAQGQRPLAYFAEVFRLADTAGLLHDPDRAVERLRILMALHGVES